MSINSTADIYTDLNGLHNLKSSARKDANGALPEVARQFESVMISMMIKGMRKTGMEDPYFSSQAMDSYRDMYDQQLAMELSKGQGIGLAKSIIEQVQTQAGLVTNNISKDRALSMPQPGYFPNQVTPFFKKGAEGDEDKLDKNWETSMEFKQPGDFVQKLWPLAEKTAKKLGVSAAVVLSQAALETGWGQYIISSDQQSSFNLFNIKAGHEWQGKRMDKVSMEYAHGKPIQQKSSFRAYQSFEQSFNDYADFVLNNPRYKNALDKVKGMEQSLHDLSETMQSDVYINSLHQSGYATDPNYAKKVMRVLNSEFIQTQVQKKT